jgi:hypothetical protein
MEYTLNGKKTILKKTMPKYENVLDGFFGRESILEISQRGNNWSKQFAWKIQDKISIGLSSHLDESERDNYYYNFYQLTRFLFSTSDSSKKIISVMGRNLQDPFIEFPAPLSSKFYLDGTDYTVRNSKLWLKPGEEYVTEIAVHMPSIAFGDQTFFITDYKNKDGKEKRGRTIGVKYIGENNAK